MAAVDPPVATVIISDPEKVIDVLVSPSPAMESSCSDPTFVKLESPRSKVPVTVRFPVMSVFAFNFIAPVPAGSSVRSALLGTEIVDPIMVRSPSDRSANASVPEPSVLRNCPMVPSDVGYANPDSVACPDVFSVPSITTPVSYTHLTLPTNREV